MKKEERLKLWKALVTAFETMKRATMQSHAAHWDKTGRFGAGCPACIEEDALRKEATELWDSAASAVAGIIENQPDAPDMREMWIEDGHEPSDI